MVFKIDLEKAYDHVIWDFLEFCLKSNEFPPIIKKVDQALCNHLLYFYFLERKTTIEFCSE